MVVPLDYIELGSARVAMLLFRGVLSSGRCRSRANKTPPSEIVCVAPTLLADTRRSSVSRRLAFSCRCLFTARIVRFLPLVRLASNTHHSHAVIRDIQGTSIMSRDESVEPRRLAWDSAIVMGMPGR